MQTRHFLLFEHPLVLDWDYLDEVLDVAVPVVEHPPGQGAAGVQVMLADELEQFLARHAVLDQRELHHVHVAEIVERVVGVINVGHAAAHSSGEVAPRPSEHHHATARHILAAVVARALDDGDGPRVAHAEALAHLAIDVELARGRTVQSGVARDDILLGLEIFAATGRGQDRDAPAREPLAEVVVGLALEPDVEAANGEGTERLAGRALEFDPYSRVGQSKRRGRYS